MNRRFGPLLAAVLLAFALCARMQAQTLARLAHDTPPDIPRSTNTSRTSPTAASSAPHLVLRESSLARTAARSLFVDSNLERARLLSERALIRDSQDAEALFVRMEAAAMQADHAAMLQAAIALCETGAGARGDPRVRLAAARVEEQAAATAEFRSVLPRLQALLAESAQPWPDLQRALLKAAMDGTPGLDPYTISHDAGILTDWRMVGPLGLHPLLDQQLLSPNDDLANDFYQNRRVENFAFPDGRIVLPSYLSHRGIFYAAAAFSSLTSGSWTVHVESVGALEVFADGERVLRTNSRGNHSAAFDVIPGPHHILLKFVGSAAPLRISVVRTVDNGAERLPSKASLQEMTYLLAAADYAAGQFSTAAEQIENVSSIANSTALQFLLEESLTSAGAISDDPTSWDELQPSGCTIDLGAVRSDRARGQLEAARLAQRKLEGCAPESLDYAQSLSDDGNHALAALSLQRLLAAAPLNRAARQMLVRELQLAGSDLAAQQAAAEWLHIAPNAENYHRLAAEWTGDDAQEEAAPNLSALKYFYVPYRRDATVIARRTAGLPPHGDSVMLLNDQVAISRPDGSVSLYVHRTTRALTAKGATEVSALRLPLEAQMLSARIVHPDGSAAALNHPAGTAQVALMSGDAIDEEYILNYTGDGGIPEHAEAFQFIFGSFDEQVLYSRFVVLTPAGRADRGAVISTGDVPAMTTKIVNGTVERLWEEAPGGNPAGTTAPSSDAGLAIVRVVEDEHGWSEPSSAEHRHKIETIHPGPRPSDS